MLAGKTNLFNFLTIFCVGINEVIALKFVTFGDSTIENDGCSSSLLGVPFPPHPPYSELNRYSSGLNWVDYFEDVYNVEVIPCACGSSLVTRDSTFNIFENSTVANIPGLVSQIDICIQDKGLLEELKTDEVVAAIIQSGGNDLLSFIFFPGATQTTEESFAAGFQEAIQKLAEIGFQNIFVGSTIYQIETPRSIFNQRNLPLLQPFFKSIAINLQNAFNNVTTVSKDEGFPITMLPVSEFLASVREEADKQGINSRDSCIDPGSPWEALRILPDCVEFNKRMWFDSVHLADWGQQQYARFVAQFFVDQGVLQEKNTDTIEEDFLLVPVPEIY